MNVLFLNRKNLFLAFRKRIFKKMWKYNYENFIRYALEIARR